MQQDIQFPKPLACTKIYFVASPPPHHLPLLLNMIVDLIPQLLQEGWLRKDFKLIINAHPPI